MSNIDGIFNGVPGAEGVSVIPLIKKGEDVSDYIQSAKSSFGRGGMATKTSIARKIADEGIDVYIANGKTENILLRLLNSDDAIVHTRFEAAEDAVSSVKKWIAHSGGFAKGKIVIDENAARILQGDKAVSLLPVGVTQIEGEFEKDDIVNIFNANNKLLGVGKVQFNAAKCREVMGKKIQRPIIHYDFLYLE